MTKREKQSTEDKGSPPDGPVCGEKFRANGCERLLRGNITVVIRVRVAFFEEYPCGVAYEDGGARHDQKHKTQANCAEEKCNPFVLRDEGENT